MSRSVSAVDHSWQDIDRCTTHCVQKLRNVLAVRPISGFRNRLLRFVCCSGSGERCQEQECQDRGHLAQIETTAFLHRSPPTCFDMWAHWKVINGYLYLVSERLEPMGAAASGYGYVSTPEIVPKNRIIECKIFVNLTGFLVPERSCHTAFHLAGPVLCCVSC